MLGFGRSLDGRPGERPLARWGKIWLCLAELTASTYGRRNLESLGLLGVFIAVIFVGVLVDASRAGDVLAFGVGAGALVLALGVFTYATKKNGTAAK